MTASQYKNILQWTLYMNRNLEKTDNLVLVKTLLDNLGVAFPTGDCKTVFTAMRTNTFLGWRTVAFEDAQCYADKGFATLAVDEGKIFIICPDEQVSNLSYDPKLYDVKNQYVKHTSELSSEEKASMSFYAYRYGFALEKTKPVEKK